jgi:hypothetical protein
MDKTNQDYLGQLSHILTIIPKKYIDALLTLHSKLDGKEIKWVVCGDLAERLRLVKVDPDCIEIVTSKDGVEKIFENVQEFNPQPVKFQTQQLTRNAVIAGKEFPVFNRSYYFDFNIKTVTIKVHGDLQFKVGNWEWGEVFDFNPEYVYVTGKKIAVTPLPIQYEFYQMLNWIDKAEKISRITKPLRQYSRFSSNDFVQN